VLRLPNDGAVRLKVRSIVGLLPLCAVTVYSPEAENRLHKFSSQVAWFNARRADLFADINAPGREGVHGRHMLGDSERTKASARFGTRSRSD
jgi:hypothetical protein